MTLGEWSFLVNMIIYDIRIKVNSFKTPFMLQRDQNGKAPATPPRTRWKERVDEPNQDGKGGPGSESRTRLARR